MPQESNLLPSARDTIAIYVEQFLSNSDICRLNNAAAKYDSNPADEIVKFQLNELMSCIWDKLMGD
jgi:hypothetical protein